MQTSCQDHVILDVVYLQSIRREKRFFPLPKIQIVGFPSKILNQINGVRSCFLPIKLYSAGGDSLNPFEQHVDFTKGDIHMG
jgi:hypothetical protein